MIYGISGLNGSGKTSWLVNKILYTKWLQGRQIYANAILDFKKPLINIWFRKPLPIKYFVDLEEIFHVRNCIIYFDEAQDTLNARKWDTLPEFFRRKLCRHRHHRIDIYGTFPQAGMVDKDFRRLLHRWFNCKRIIQIGRNRSYFGIFLVREKDPEYFSSATTEAIDIPDKPFPILRLFHYLFFIHYFSPKRYNTEDDITINFYRILCSSDQKQNLKYHIIPRSERLRQGYNLL